MAIIPARGGSKRIPGKNIRYFAGKPMLAHSIDCARQSGLFDKIIVSTDDDSVAEVARAYGAETPFSRPPELSDDHAGITEVVSHSVNWLYGQGADLSAVCCILATAPFIRKEDIKLGLVTLETGNWQYVFSATTCEFPILRSLRKSKEGGIEMFFPEHFLTRSQDLTEALHDAGQFYWGRPQAWLDEARIFDKTTTVLIIPRWRVQDIDTPEDWERAQIMWQVLHNT